ncbi:MAG: hypothetical protein R3D67_21870 [Hyphomicrobiaceae bacterium]
MAIAFPPDKALLETAGDRGDGEEINAQGRGRQLPPAWLVDSTPLPMTPDSRQALWRPASTGFAPASPSSMRKVAPTESRSGSSRRSDGRFSWRVAAHLRRAGRNARGTAVSVADGRRGAICGNAISSPTMNSSISTDGGRGRSPSDRHPAPCS